MSRRIHISWHISSASAGILIGVLCSSFLIGPSGLALLVATLCFIAAGFINGRILGLVLFFISGAVFGFWRGSLLINSLSAYDNLYEKTITVRGIVAEDPSIATDGDVQFRLSDVQVNDDELSGQVWVSTSEKIELRRSDIITIKGTLSKGFGGFIGSLYRAEVLDLKRKDFSDVGRDVRDSFAESVRRGINEPEASLAAGFLVGQKTALPEKLDNELRLLGLTHIVVASGYNLTILVRFARRFFERISRFTALAFASFLVYGFMQITGNSPSMARASLITILSLIAWYYGRKIHPFVLIPFSAAITVLINPAYLWGDIGWYLSFTSFIGVIVLSPLIGSYFWGGKRAGSIRQVVIETMSAQLLTLPIIAYIFGQYSPLALIANVLIVPLIPLAMLLIFVTGLTGYFGTFLATIIGRPAQALLDYMTFAVDKLAALPAASNEVNFSINALILSYIFLFWLVLFLWRKSGHEFREFNVVE